MKFFKSSAVALAVLILVVAAGSVYGLSRKPLEVQYHQWIADDAAMLGKEWGLGQNDMLLLMIEGKDYQVLYGNSVNSTITDTQESMLRRALDSDYYDGDYDQAALKFFRAADVVFAQLGQQ